MNARVYSKRNTYKKPRTLFTIFSTLENQHS